MTDHYPSCCCYECHPGRPLVDWAMPVWRVRVEKVTDDLAHEQVHSVRVAAHSQAEVEKVAERLLTRWLRTNPGVPGTYVISTLPLY